MKHEELLKGQSIPHDSASKHVSGFAEYTDDISEPINTLYGAIGWSEKAHAKIKKIDLSNVRKSEGVKSVITFRDIPGRNDVGPVFDGDPIFPKSKVEYFGQPLFAVAATTTELARKAVLKAKVTYIELKPIITIQEALKKNNLLFKPRIVKKGNPQNKINRSKNKLKGKFNTGSQEHFYLEGQVCLVIPKEDNNFQVYSSTQHPSETQQIIAKMLNQKSNSITVSVRRIGGGFGGKETNFMTAAICALLSHKAKQPIKLRLDRDDDIILTGKRHDFYSEYEVGFNDHGKKIDCSISTFACPIAPSRVSSIWPDAKFIICVREPVSRAISHWKMILDIREDIENGEDWTEFEKAWQDTRLRENSLYGQSMERWLRLFPVDRFLIIDSRKMKEEPEKVIRDVFSHLGVDQVGIDLDRVFSNIGENRRQTTILGKIMTYLESLVPSRIRIRIANFLRGRGLNPYKLPLVSRRIMERDGFLGEPYQLAYQEVTEDLKLFSKLTDFDINDWLSEIDKSASLD